VIVDEEPSPALTWSRCGGRRGRRGGDRVVTDPLPDRSSSASVDGRRVCRFTVTLMVTAVLCAPGTELMQPPCRSR